VLQANRPQALPIIVRELPKRKAEAVSPEHESQKQANDLGTSFEVRL